MTRMSRSALVASLAVTLLISSAAFAASMKGKPAPEIKVGSWLNSEKGVTLEGLRGKIVVLEFWGTWSKVCLQRVPQLKKLHESYAKKGVVVVAVSDEGMSTVKETVENLKIKYIVGAEAGVSASFFGVQGVPMAFLIDPTGVVQWEGAELDELDKVIAGMVGAPVEGGETVEPKPAAAGDTNPAAEKPVVKSDAVAAAANSEEKKSEEKKDEVFILADRGWRDPFTDPRDKGESRVVEDQPPQQVGEEVQKIWENARDSLVLEGIMGWENDLKAVVGGVTVRPGDMLSADKLKFKVESVTRDNVEFRCVNEEEKYRDLKDLKVKKTIGL